MTSLFGVAALLAACGSSSKPSSTSPSKTKAPAKAAVAGLYGTLPSAGTPSNGGTISVGEISGSTPEFILPITPENLATIYGDFEFQYTMWSPLYWAPDGSVPKVDPTLSLASAPTFSDHDKTVTIQMKKNYTWSANGASVDANDVIFYIDLVKQAVKENADNYNNYSPGFFPDNVVSATAPSKYTVVLHLTKAYNPGYFYDDQLNLIQPLPSTYWNVDSASGAHITDWATNTTAAKEIYNYLKKEGGDLSTFASNPLWQDVDGPLQLTSFSATNGSYTQKVNPHYDGPQKPRFTTLDAESFTTDQSLFNALEGGTLDFAGFNGEVDPSEIPEFSKLSGYTVFGLPEFGFNAAFFNFEDTTDHFNKVISQLYIRQALAYLQDQPGYVKAKGLLDNAGGVDYGPIPSEPVSPYAPKDATTAPYPYSVSSAESLLKSHGWKVVPNGVDSCIKPGTAADECGAGIPSGTKLSFSLQYATTPPLTKAESEAYASATDAAGIKLTLTSKTFDYLVENDNDPAVPSNKDHWEIVDFGGFTQDLYPTTNTLFNTGGDYNLGGYNSAEADKLITASVSGGNPAAVTTEANYMTKNLPVLFQPLGDILTIVKNTIGGTPDSFLTTTQDYFTPQYWYVKAKS